MPFIQIISRKDGSFCVRSDARDKEISFYADEFQAARRGMPEDGAEEYVPRCDRWGKRVGMRIGADGTGRKDYPTRREIFLNWVGRQARRQGEDPEYWRGVMERYRIDLRTLFDGKAEKRRLTLRAGYSANASGGRSAANWGGKRPGAGRPAGGGAKWPEELTRWFEEYARKAARDRSLGWYVGFEGAYEAIMGRKAPKGLPKAFARRVAELQRDDDDAAGER